MAAQVLTTGAAFEEGTQRDELQDVQGLQIPSDTGRTISQCALGAWPPGAVRLARKPSSVTPTSTTDVARAFIVLRLAY
jgi:hypothetical protein